MRCPKCRKTIDPGTKICPGCKIVTIDGSSNDSQGTDILKPQTHVSIKGLGSRMSGTSHVTATRHKITALVESTSSQKIQCLKCHTINDKSRRLCRNCGTRITSR